jgi:DNA repair protein RadC
MKELPISERPYEKLELQGEKSLTNAELLAIIIKSGTKDQTSVELAQSILRLNTNKDEENLNFLRDISIEEFMKIKGIGRVKAIQLKAICELAIRMNKPVNYRRIQIRTPFDFAKVVMDELRFLKREVVKVAMLDNKNLILKIADVSMGGSNFANVQIKDILIEAIKIQAPKIILVHNHPSGDSTPSHVDFELTERVKKAAELIGITLADHIVIGNLEYTSIFSEIAKRKSKEKNCNNKN